MNSRYGKTTGRINNFIRGTTEAEMRALVLIWQHCGREKFLWNYVTQFGDGKKLSSSANLYNKGYIHPAGYVDTWGKPVKLWKLTSDIASRLESTYGMPSETILSDCRRYISEYRDHFKMRHKYQAFQFRQRAMA